MQQLLTIREASEQLRLSPSSLKNKQYRQRLGIPVVYLGSSVRFTAQDLEQFVARNRQAPAPEVDHGAL
jgi:hypothetical protein